MRSVLPVTLGTKLKQAPRGAAALAATGIVRPYRPSQLVRIGRDLLRWGTGPAGGYLSLADRFPDEVGLIDDLGSLTFGEVNDRSNALAHSLARRGVHAGDRVAVMCRNHRWFIETALALAKLGADALYLNTAFSGPQLADVLAREKPTALVYDEEFAGVVEPACGDDVQPILAWSDGDVSGPTVERLIGDGDPGPRPVPDRAGSSIILTSGTTGTPKGAPRGAGNVGAAAALLSAIPLKHRWTCHIAVPLFHTWGWAHFQLGLLLGSTLVLRRHFDPEDCLATVEHHRCDSLAVVPVMLQRMLRLPEEVRSSYSLRTLKAVVSSGSALPGALALEWMDAAGDTLYNVYGSTECAWATIAAPADLRAAPGTAGRPPIGTEVRLYDDHDRPAPAGASGRIFVSNSMLFEGYTGGDSKDTLGHLMATGDVGRFDDEGRLFVEGRDDEMIVSGAENVFPAEVEDCLVMHPDVVEAAAVGVPDEEFGQRLRAYVVLREPRAAGEDELKDYVKEHLARFKVPREIRFVEELPRNPTGKVLKRKLDAS
ncbi:MAG: AMP-binding protein [Propionibacteriales bacterium]|nr:AMP-binding protein [Propionibacteriales bacterium]